MTGKEAAALVRGLSATEIAGAVTKAGAVRNDGLMQHAQFYRDAIASLLEAPTKDADMTNYVTRDRFDTLVDQVGEVQKALRDHRGGSRSHGNLQQNLDDHAALCTAHGRSEPTPTRADVIAEMREASKPVENGSQRLFHSYEVRAWADQLDALEEEGRA